MAICGAAPDRAWDGGRFVVEKSAQDCARSFVRAHERVHTPPIGVPGRYARGVDLPLMLMVVLGAATVVASPVMVVALWLDKRRAGRGAWRISEHALHRIELAGGWAASLVGRRLLRHKTRKGSYRLVAGCIAAGHVAAWLGLAAWAIRAG